MHAYAVVMHDLGEAVGAGDRRGALQAAAELLVRSLIAAPAANHAALVKELRSVLKELAELPVVTEVSPVDDLAQKRADRRSKAKGAAGSVGGVVGRG